MWRIEQDRLIGISRIALSHRFLNMELTHDMVAVANHVHGSDLQVYDYSDPARPFRTASSPPVAGQRFKLRWKDNHLIAAEEHSLVIYNYTGSLGNYDDDDYFAPVPIEFGLSAPYPNPFNASTNMAITIPNSGEIELGIYDISGRLIQTLLKRKLEAGTTPISIDASELNSGVYLVKLSGNGKQLVRKLVVLK